MKQSTTHVMAALAAIPILSLSALAADSKKMENTKTNERDKDHDDFISAHADDGKQVDRAKKIFEELGAEDICTVPEATAPAA